MKSSQRHSIQRFVDSANQSTYMCVHRRVDSQSVCSIPESIAYGLLSQQKISEFSPVGFGKAIQHVHLVLTRANYSDSTAKHTTNDGIQTGDRCLILHSLEQATKRHAKIRFQQKATFQLIFSQLYSD